MNDYPYLKKAKMPACKTILCEHCKKVHVPASKPRVMGKTLCIECSKTHESKYTRKKAEAKRLKNGKQEQKKVLS